MLTPTKQTVVKPTLKASVVICTHNPRVDYLQQVLASLEEQDCPKTDWEAILVDNASVPAVAESVQPEEYSFLLRIVRENKLGLVHARLRGIQEAQGELIVFVDDDNVLSPDYLTVAWSILSENSQLGCIGGTIEPRYEMPPPANLAPYLSALAVRCVKGPIITNRYDGSCAPYGAGLVTTRNVAERYRRDVVSNDRRMSLGRSGNGYLASEDIDIAFTACDLGKACGLFPELGLIHLIPKQRLKKSYLCRLLKGVGYSNIHLLASRGRYKPSLTRLMARLCELCFHALHREDKSRRKRYELLGQIKAIYELLRQR